VGRIAATLARTASAPSSNLIPKPSGPRRPLCLVSRGFPPVSRGRYPRSVPPSATDFRDGRALGSRTKLAMSGRALPGQTSADPDPDYGRATDRGDDRPKPGDSAGTQANALRKAPLPVDARRRARLRAPALHVALSSSLRRRLDVQEPDGTAPASRGESTAISSSISRKRSGSVERTWLRSAPSLDNSLSA
jgi:hypothetical protein